MRKVMLSVDAGLKIIAGDKKAKNAESINSSYRPA